MHPADEEEFERQRQEKLELMKELRYWKNTSEQQGQRIRYLEDGLLDIIEEMKAMGMDQ